MVKATVENMAPHKSRTAEGISAQARFIVEASDLRGLSNIRKAPVVIVSTAMRHNRERKEGRRREGISCFNGRGTMWPVLDSF